MNTAPPHVPPVTSAQQDVAAGPSDRRGLFLAFEGGDGSGKSTHVADLARWLESQGIAVVVTREPGGCPLGNALREVLLHGGEVSARAEALLFAADRADHVEMVVRPALARGQVVITDRYIDSSVAYQGAGRGLGPSQILALSQWATAELYPDLTVLLDVPPDVGLARAGGGGDRMESAGQAFHAAVRAQFLAGAATAADRYLVLDASLPKADVAARIRARIHPMLRSLVQGDLPLEPWGTP